LRSYNKHLLGLGDSRPALDSALDTLPPVLKEAVSSSAAIVGFMKVGQCPGDTIHYDSLNRELKTFGFTRFYFMDLIELTIKTDFYIVVDTLIDDSVLFFQVAMDAVVAYEHSTFLHQQFEKLLNLCIATQPHDIVHKILVQSNLPLDLIALENENTRITSEGGPQYQYLPVLRSIGRTLQGLLNKTENVQLQDYIELTDGWDAYQQKLVQLSTIEAEQRMSNEALKSGSRGSFSDSVGTGGRLKDSFEMVHHSTPVEQKSLDDLLADMASPGENADTPASVDDLLGDSSS